MFAGGTGKDAPGFEEWEGCRENGVGRTGASGRLVEEDTMEADGVIERSPVLERRTRDEGLMPPERKWRGGERTRRR